MEILIQRFRRREDSLDGWLKINGELICDTAECPQNALPTGTYRIEMTRCKQHEKKVLRLVSYHAPAGTEAKCEKCPLQGIVGANTTMPCVCPMITIGNGVRGRSDGSIIVGERVVFGTLIHSTAAFDKLYERIKKSVQRKNEVVVRIE